MGGVEGAWVALPQQDPCSLMGGVPLGLFAPTTRLMRSQATWLLPPCPQVCRVQWQNMRTTEKADEVMAIMNDIKWQFEAHTPVQGGPLEQVGCLQACLGLVNSSASTQWKWSRH